MPEVFEIPSEKLKDYLGQKYKWKSISTYIGNDISIVKVITRNDGEYVTKEYKIKENKTLCIKLPKGSRVTAVGTMYESRRIDEPFELLISDMPSPTDPKERHRAVTCIREESIWD